METKGGCKPSREDGKPCPVCQYELSATIEAGRDRCPECGWKFTEQDLQQIFDKPDRAGEPQSLSPHERRVSGRVLIVFFLSLLLIMAAVVIWLGYAASDSPGG